MTRPTLRDGTRPTLKEGRAKPAVGLIGLGLLILGAMLVSSHQASGWWVIMTGAGLVITFGLIFWRLAYGMIFSVGMWLTLIGVFWRVHPGIPFQDHAWIALAGGGTTTPSARPSTDH